MLSEAFSTSLTSALIGAVAGAMGALLMALISWLTALGWGGAVLLGEPGNGPQMLQLLLPLAAGLAIGLLRQQGADPLPELHSTIEELHEHTANTSFNPAAAIGFSAFWPWWVAAAWGQKPCSAAAWLNGALGCRAGAGSKRFPGVALQPSVALWGSLACPWWVVLP